MAGSTCSGVMREKAGSAEETPEVEGEEDGASVDRHARSGLVEDGESDAVVDRRRSRGSRDPGEVVARCRERSIV